MTALLASCLAIAFAFQTAPSRPDASSPPAADAGDRLEPPESTLPPPGATNLRTPAISKPPRDTVSDRPRDGETPNSPEGDAHEKPSLTAAERVRILDAALADFDAGVATRNQAGAEARAFYRRAADGFDRLIRADIRNGALYYNLGNARVRLGELGPAIVAYRRALRLMPGDENIRRNLRFARQLCDVRIQPGAAGSVLRTIFFWHYDTSNAARTRAAIACYVAFWILLGLRLFVRVVPVLNWSTGIVGVLALVLTCSVGWERMRIAHQREGVLIADNVTLRKGNGENYDPQLTAPLSQGVEFEVREDRTDSQGREWYYVELADGTDGWLPADKSELI